MAASSVALRHFFHSNNNAAAASSIGLGIGIANYSIPLPQRMRRKGEIMLRSSSASSSITIPIITTTNNHLSIYSSSLAEAAIADQDVDCNNQLDDQAIFKMTVGLETTSSSKHKEDGDAEEEEEPAVSIAATKLDEWMRDSVSEIVRNIGEAPFLVHIHSSSNEIEGDDDGANTDASTSSSTKETATSRKTRLEREPAVSDDWPRISRRWKENSSCKPDGIILVEQLKGQEEEEELMEYCGSSSHGRYCPCSNPKTWGIVIQGRGLDCAACYILKTTRVCSSVGFCTHFCLIKAKCFGDPAELQLRDCWLQRQ